MSEIGVASTAPPENAIVLARDPFAMRAPIPFRDAQCTRLLAQLRHLIDKTELLVMVSGPVGSGKSVLCQMFVESVPSHFVVLSLDASVGLRSVDLLSEVADRFGNRRRKSDDIHDLFTAHYSRGKQPVLVIDSAENLEVRALQLAAKLAEHGLHLVLFVRSDAEAAVAEKLDVERVQVLRVSSFDERRTYCYLQHCLVTAGYQGPMPFDQAALKDISAQGGGTPAGINRLAHQYLRAQPTLPAARSTSARLERGAGPRMVIVGVLLALVLGVLAVLVLTGRLGSGGVSGSARLSNLEQREADRVATRVTTDASQHELPAPAADPAVAAPVVVPAPVRKDLAPSSPAVATTPTTLGDDPGSEIVEVPAAIEEMELDAVSADLDEPETPLPDAPTPARATPPKNTASVPAQEEIGSLPQDAETGPLEPDNAAVRARDPRHFTMQLVSGPSLDSVQRFATRYGVGAESAIYRFDRDGEANYALIYRDYATREEALDALDALPDDLKARKPWLRRLSSIQRMIGED